jgi:hypothetical protein
VLAKPRDVLDVLGRVLDGVNPELDLPGIRVLEIRWVVPSLPSWASSHDHHDHAAFVVYGGNLAAMPLTRAATAAALAAPKMAGREQDCRLRAAGACCFACESVEERSAVC